VVKLEETLVLLDVVHKVQQCLLWRELDVQSRVS
jgi:hypothetical protein